MLCDYTALRFLQAGKRKLFILAFCTVLGAVIGAALAAYAGTPYIQLMRMAPMCRVSIVGSVLTAFLPFLVSCLLIVHSKPWLVYPVCSFWVLMTTGSRWGIHAAFGSAGWLIALLMLLPQMCYTLVLLYLSICRLTGQLRKDATTFLVLLCFGIGMMDYAFVSPFLAELTDSYETMGRYAIHVGLDWRL